MKKLFTLMAFVVTLTTFGQSVAISSDGSKADASAMLDIKSTTKGFLPPRMNVVQRDAIKGAVAGLQIWCSDCDGGETQIWNGSIWSNFTGASGPQGETGNDGSNGSDGATGSAGSANISGTTNHLIKFTGATTGGNSKVFDDGTNVGIGTTTPAAKLDVAGTLKITDGTEGAGKVLTSDATGLATWQTNTGSQKIYFSAANDNNNSALPNWSFNKSNNLIDTKITNTNIILIQQTGLYVINCSATLLSTEFLLNLNVNGVPKFGSSPSSGYTAAGATWGSVSRAWSILLNAGDEVEVVTGAGSLWDGAGTRDILTIYKID
jgi:hypothetical protein